MELVSKQNRTTTVSKKENASFFKKSELPFFLPALIQPKLTVGAADDPYEREADAVADHVMRMKDSNRCPFFFSPVQPMATLQRQCASCKSEEETIRRKEEDEEELLPAEEAPAIQRKCAACQAEEENVQRKDLPGHLHIQRKLEECKEEKEKELPPMTLKVASAVQAKGVKSFEEVPPIVYSSLETADGRGSVMDKRTLSFMASRFQRNFSEVKIHTGVEATLMNRQLGARAFTLGKNIYFNEGEYQPGSFEGKKLLAHELTHVVQQTNVQPVRSRVFRKPDENEAQPAGSVGKESVCDQYPVGAGTTQATGPVNEPESPAGANLPNTKPPEAKPAIPSPQTAGILTGVNPPAAARPSTKNTEKVMPDDPAFHQLVRDAEKQAKKQKSHDKPKVKTTQAVDAVELKGEQEKKKAQEAIDSGATVLSVDAAVQASETQKTFDADKFKTDLKQKLEKAFLDTETDPLPENHEEATQLVNNRSKLDAVTDGTKADLKKAKNEVVGDAEKIKDTKNPEEQYKDAIVKAPALAYTPDQPGERPVIRDPQRAIPKPLGEEEMQMDQDHDADSLDRVMAEHQVSDNQLAESEEPQFLDTLETKQASQRQLCQVPQRLRQAEQIQQQGDAVSAAQLIRGEMGGMHGTRKNQFGQVQEKQEGVKTEGELRLQEYYTDLKNIYETTELNVRNCLAYLECSVTTLFQNAVDKAFDIFKTNVTSRLDYYYDWHIIRRDYEKEDKMTKALVNDRIDREIRELTAQRNGFPENDSRWKQLNDRIATLRRGRAKLIIEKIFDEEKKTFTDALDATINEITVIVGEGLQRAKRMINDGRERINREKSSLSKENQEKATEATNDFTEKFNDLENRVNEKEEDLKEGLVKQYTESVARLKSTFEEIRKEAAISWWERAWRKIKEIVTIIIDIGKLLLKILAKAAGVIGNIIAHPIRFFGNLIEGISLGFNNFVKRLPEHLENIIFKLILGVVPEGISLPDKWDAKGIFSFVLDILGFSKQNIRTQAVTKFGEPVVQELEQGFELFVIFKNEGFAGLWEYIKEKIGDLKDAIIEEVKTFFREAIIKAAIEFLLSALTPASGFIKVCKAIIGIVSFLIKNLVNILKLLDSILDSFVDFVAGKVQKAAGRVETALEDILLIGIKFLAALVGINLDKIQSKIAKIIHAVRSPVNRAIQWLLDKAQQFADSTGLLGLIRKGKQKLEASKEWAKQKADKGKAWIKGNVEAGKEKVKAVAERVIQWWKVKKSLKFGDGQTHTLYFEGEGVNARLMMRSMPQSYQEFVKEIVIGTKDIKKRKQQEAAKAKALVVAGEIDGLVRRTKTEDGTKDMTPEFRKKLDELAAHTLIFTKRDEGQLPVSTAPIYGKLQNGFATRMKIEKLTRLGPPGTEVNVENPLMITLKQRLEVERSYYIAGHLLNHNLHGSGDTWQNLTPLTQKANRQHLRSIESSLKSAVAKGRVFSYTVDVHYGRTINRQLIKQIEGSNDSQPVKAIKKQIVIAEQYVPFGITGKVQELDYNGKPLTKGDLLNLDLSVVNSIDQAGPAAYNVKR